MCVYLVCLINHCGNLWDSRRSTRHRLLCNTICLIMTHILIMHGKHLYGKGTSILGDLAYQRVIM